jgi:1-acyl-sn-glycerol-3-phosphate acyltransferase
MLRPAGRLALRLRWQVRVVGASNVPAEGPVLLASNHIGLFDGPLLFAVAPRMVHTLIKREMFDGPAGSAFRALGQISIERQGTDLRAVRTAVRVLREGGVVGIYPEGARGGGEVAHTRLGLAYLAMVAGATVVPVANLGTRLPGGRVRSVPPSGSLFDVVFGPSIAVAPQTWPRRHDLVALVAEQLRVRLAEHVARAVDLTGHSLPGPAPDEAVDAPGRRGPEVGPAVQEESR